MILAAKEKEVATIEQLRDNVFYRCVCKKEKNICNKINAEYDRKIADSDL